jgi:hypothetical protein
VLNSSNRNSISSLGVYVVANREIPRGNLWAKSHLRHIILCGEYSKSSKVNVHSVSNIYITFPFELDIPGIHSASNRNEYQKHNNNNLSGSKVRWVRRADNLTAISEPIA